MKKNLNNNFKELGEAERRAVVENNSIDIENRRISFVLISDDNSGLRRDPFSGEIFKETLDVNGADYSRLTVFLKDHNREIDSVVGKIENPRIENSKMKIDVVFGRDEQSDIVFNKYKDGLLTDVSAGYVRRKIEMIERKDEPKEMVVRDYEIIEVSAVWRGFDKYATVGRNAEDLEKEAKKDDCNSLLRKKIKRRIRLTESL